MTAGVDPSAASGLVGYLQLAGIAVPAPLGEVLDSLCHLVPGERNDLELRSSLDGRRATARGRLAWGRRQARSAYEMLLYLAAIQVC